MEQCSPFGWVYYNEDEGMMGELRQYIMQSRMELEATVITAQEEIMNKDEELLSMKDLLMVAIKERDEAKSKLQNLVLEKLLLQRQLDQLQKQKTITAPITNTNTINNTTNCLNSSTSSDQSDESSSIISSPTGGSSLFSLATQPPPLPPPLLAAIGGSRHPLPEKGKLLKAVMEAGPLLQTLLLAGPLPRWQHPPPQLDSIEIPPVKIRNPNSNQFSPNKRGIDNLDCSVANSSSPSIRGLVSLTRK